MSLFRRHYWFVAAAGITLAFAGVSFWARPSPGLTAFGDIFGFLIVGLAAAIALANAKVRGSRGILTFVWRIFAEVVVSRCRERACVLCAERGSHILAAKLPGFAPVGVGTKLSRCASGALSIVITILLWGGSRRTHLSYQRKRQFPLAFEVSRY